MRCQVFLRRPWFQSRIPPTFFSSRWTHQQPSPRRFPWKIRYWTALRVQFSRELGWFASTKNIYHTLLKRLDFCWFNGFDLVIDPQINKIKDLIFDLVNRTMQKIMYEVGGDLRSNLTITFANEPEWTLMAMIQIPYNSHFLQKTSVLRSFEMDWNGYLYITCHWIIWILER